MNQQTSRISIAVYILAVGCFILAVVVVVLAMGQFYPGVLSIGFRSSSVPVQQSIATTNVADSQLTNLPAGVLNLEEVERLVRALPPETQARVLADSKAFAEAVRREAVRRSVLQAALASGLATNGQISYLSKRASEQVLINSYMQLHANANVSEEFPSDAQIQSFYDQNQASFTVGERVLLWQVFIPIPVNSNSATVADQEKYATDLATKIRNGKLNFTDAALAHTGHDASRLQGGFMGFLSVSQLVPEVGDALPTLVEGDVGGPIRGKDGFHIIQRGPIIPAQILPLAQVAEQIRTQLRQVDQRNRQQAVLSSSHEKFSNPLSEQDVERWRLRLSGQN